jgi:hypothetical protein
VITDADGLLADRFAATRDSHEDADWSDVLRRRTPGRQVDRGRVRLVAVAVAVIAVVPTAIGLAGPLHDLFFGRPAPPIVKQAFAQQNRMARLMHTWQKAHGETVPAMPRVETAKAHGVLAVKTHDGLLLLWAAPSSGGRECWFIDFAADQVNHRRPLGDGGCDSPTPPASKFAPSFSWSATHPTLKVLSGRLYVDDAVAVIVSFPNHRSATLPVVDRYFVAAYPRSTRVPTKLAAINRHGHVVATLTLSEHR